MDDLQNELKEYRQQLDTVQSGLQLDPDNAELQNLQTELEEVITLTETAITELKPESVLSDPPPKWSKENHPAYQERREEEVVFSVNDNVLAKWKSGDKSFYPAKITSITGSATNPVYIVTFKSYATTETLSANEIKPMSNKRKADSMVPANTGTVISAAASINPLAQAKREPSKVSDGPIRPAKVPRQVKANKELEAGKNKWQEFTIKGRGKKESMFRTPDGVNARVGFTGSGQEMRKDPARSRHVYERGEDE